MPPFRKAAKEVSPSTQLVQQLYSFGQEEPLTPESNLERSSTTDSPSAQPQASTSKLSAEALSNLSLSSPPSANPSTASTKKKPLAPSALRKLLRSQEHVVRVKDGEEEQERVLTSWKMADYAYKRDPCPFPTRARGLFTEKVGEDEYRIVARGYDKFFNVNEVSWTQWDKIPEYSTGPYELTTKSNGCIILIAALTPEQIIVTSKHSIGSNAFGSTENGQSHSERGEDWLEKHVARVGKKKEDLARELYERNLTAVAELCDDAFEEHVLPYPAEQTGLHLHGLNHNSPTLNTLPSSEVASFAKTWGMIPTPFFVFPSVVAVKTYCETVEQAGGVEFTPGKTTPVEGFVVRGKRRGTAANSGEAFFWKVKYDEPYLMYREWRELTRKCLAVYPELDGVDPKKVKNPESRLYLWWVKREMEKDRAKFDSWKHGKGMIKTREEFQKWEKSSDGRKARRELGEVVEFDAEEKKNMKFDKTIIVPIAVQGCGKTALGLELSQLYGWGHVQSDDFLVKKPAPHFLRKIKELLSQHNVVFADKNNHQTKHRQDLVGLVNSLPHHRIRLVALVYPVDSATLPRDKFHALMSSRIVARGENHQSLRAGESHESIIWQFLGQHEPFDPATNGCDGRFDEVIEMKAEWEQGQALEEVVKALSVIEGLGVVDPGEEKRKEAIEYAKSWKVKTKKESPSQPDTAIKKRSTTTKANAGPRYYGLSVKADLRELVERHLPKEILDNEESLWNTIKKASRVEKNPHVTLVHQVELEHEDEAFRAKKRALWSKYETMVQAATKEGSSIRDQEKLDVEVVLGSRIVWDTRAISIEISAFVNSTVKEEEEGESSSSSSIDLVEGRGAHITVGTKSSDIRPVEGKWIMEAVSRGDAETKEGGKIQQVSFEPIKVKARLAGLS